MGVGADSATTVAGVDAVRVSIAGAGLTLASLAGARSLSLVGAVPPLLVGALLVLLVGAILASLFGAIPLLLVGADLGSPGGAGFKSATFVTVGAGLVVPPARTGA